MTKYARSQTPTSSARTAIQGRFRRLYLVLTVLFSGMAIAIVAWHWNQPKPYANGFSYAQSIPILLVASVLVNGIAFYFQNRHLRRTLSRPNAAAAFRAPQFALRFYLYHLATAVALSVVGFFPLLALLFFYWIYPVTFWLIPYQAIIGAILGRDIERQLRSQATLVD